MADCDRAGAERVAKAFAAGWRAEVDSLGHVIVNTFQEKATGYHVLRVACEAVGRGYERFHEVVDGAYRPRPPFQSDMLNAPRLQMDLAAVLEEFARANGLAA
eukprot:c3913_g1_i1.p3 GENE.c3913_g1_i1~~c3913_g1_i1.p3  ORF type:complete len:120 (+),score=30.60 c3913_g1_i1:52-360(+)